MMFLSQDAFLLYFIEKAWQFPINYKIIEAFGQFDNLEFQVIFFIESDNNSLCGDLKE